MIMWLNNYFDRFKKPSRQKCDNSDNSKNSIGAINFSQDEISFSNQISASHSVCMRYHPNFSEPSIEQDLKHIYEKAIRDEEYEEAADILKKAK